MESFPSADHSAILIQPLLTSFFFCVAKYAHLSVFRLARHLYFSFLIRGPNFDPHDISLGDRCSSCAAHVGRVVGRYATPHIPCYSFKVISRSALFLASQTRCIIFARNPVDQGPRLLSHRVIV